MGSAEILCRKDKFEEAEPGLFMIMGEALLFQSLKQCSEVVVMFSLVGIINNGYVKIWFCNCCLDKAPGDGIQLSNTVWKTQSLHLTQV